MELIWIPVILAGLVVLLAFIVIMATRSHPQVHQRPRLDTKNPAQPDYSRPSSASQTPNQLH